MARSAPSVHDAQAALSDHCAARDAVADELDDVDTRILQRVETERATHTPHRRLRGLHDLLLVGDEAIEIDRRVDVLALLAKVGRRVDAVELHEQHRHVLDVDLDECVGRGVEPLRLRRRKREFDALQEALVTLWVFEQRIPARHVSLPREQLGLGKDASNPLDAHERCPSIERIRLRGSAACGEAKPRRKRRRPGLQAVAARSPEAGQA